MNIPNHVAIVMDGNGRWAKERGLPRTAGHEAGEAALFDVVQGAIEFGVKEISAYAFSTENWRRSPEEVKFLMGFNRDVLRRRRDEMNAMGVRIRWVGRPGSGSQSNALDGISSPQDKSPPLNKQPIGTSQPPMEQ